MPRGPAHKVLVVDDDPDALSLASRILESGGYEVVLAEGGLAGLETFEKESPRLVLLDVEMPDLNGYAVSERMREMGPPTPVVFVTGLSADESREQAVSIGAVGYLVKPYSKDQLLEVVAEHIDDVERWSRLHDGQVQLAEAITPADFQRFKRMLAARAHLSGEGSERLMSASPAELYDRARVADVQPIDVAEMIADFLNLEVVGALDPASVDMEGIPAAFGERNLVAKLVTEDDSVTFALANPFDWNLLDTLERHRVVGGQLRLVVTEPEGILAIFRLHKGKSGEEGAFGSGVINLPEGRATLRTRTGSASAEVAVSLRQVQEQPVVFIANNLILEVLREGASDIHLEPKEDSLHIRFRVDGDMHDVLKLSPVTGVKLISRLKALAGLDIAERRKPQDGALEVHAGSRKLKLRLATSSGPFGESMVVRVLDQTAKPMELVELGMTPEQAGRTYGYAGRTHGMILVVGPTGSGKTTTIYSILSSVDTERRSLMSVEDPVEYLIARANQQQVNDKAGVTFDSLLKSSVRQDPDILFLGEIRDNFSARTAVDFASTGHLTISTLHTSTATSAVFRLERLGVERSMMADSVLCIVAQRLVKRLCPSCRIIDDITQEERELLAPFTRDIPERVARPGNGCSECRRGYLGRELVCEVLEFDEQLKGWIRGGMPVSDLRAQLVSAGAYLIHEHALDKIRAFTFSVRDAYDRVLVEEEQLFQAVAPSPPKSEAAPQAAPPVEAPEEGAVTDAEPELILGKDATAGAGAAQPEEGMIGAVAPKRKILLAEDDESTRLLLTRVLEEAGYEVTSVEDGLKALEAVSASPYALVLSDVEMPGLDGMQMFRRMQQRGIETPVLMLTGSSEGSVEADALSAGVLDFVTKPVRRDVLLIRVERALRS